MNESNLTRRTLLAAAAAIPLQALPPQAKTFNPLIQWISK